MAVTSTNNLRKGSKGSDVTELQKLLNQNGYNLAEDGSFGAKTLAAVKDYQQKNGLAVDGVVGTNTWGALTKATSTTPTTQEEVKAPTFEYMPSDAVQQADALLQQQMAQKPGEYQSTWGNQLNDTIAKILNQEKFSYDLNKDALYQQYADQFTTQGKLASMDVMGQAAAMTGGYGNSYAQTAGQQAYQSYLQQLNDVVPELYGMALDQHNQERQALYDQASLMAQMEDQDYGRYRDQLSDYYTDLNYLTENARYMSETEYQKALDAFNIKYGAYRDDVADKQWQTEFDESKRQYDQQYALSKKSSSGGSGGGSGSGTGGSGGNGYDNGGLSTQAIKNMQITLGVTADGKWGSESQKAAGGLSAEEAYAKWNKGELAGATSINEGSVKAFMSKIHPESQHDAVARDMYGSYRQYVAEQIEKANLNDAEKAYLISYYGITESDLNYKH